MPNVIVIAGPNGAGKSTLAPALLRDTFGILEYVNADTIAEGLSAFAPLDASFDAGRVMLGRLHDLAEVEKDFAFETTLASRTYARWLSELKETSGYRVSVIFLWLRDVELAIARVAARVELGGHSIPEETIRRRFERGKKISSNSICLSPTLENVQCRHDTARRDRAIYWKGRRGNLQ
jgi:predicted ABC-type ATPase